MSRRRTVGLGLALALALGACSGGGTKESAPTLAREEPTPATAEVAVSPTHVVTGLGPCPAAHAATSLTIANGGIVGLAKRLVPIDAVNVRVCEYETRWVTPSEVRPGRLVGSALLKPRAARQFEEQTNRLSPALPGAPSCTGPGGGGIYMFATFASDSQRVTLEQDLAPCSTDVVSNGYFEAGATPGWQIALHDYAPTRPGL